MGLNNTGGTPFWTREAILALALMDAGCRPAFQSPMVNGSGLLPCIRHFSEDMIFTHGGGVKERSGEVTTPSRFADMHVFDAAKVAWEEGMKGDVSYGFILDKESSKLVQAYRAQAKAIDDGDGKVYDTLKEIMGYVKQGAMMVDEAIVRSACVILKTRKEYVMQWEQTVPILSVRLKGRTNQFESSVSVEGKTYRADAFSKPGFKTIFLNATPKTRKECGF